MRGRLQPDTAKVELERQCARKSEQKESVTEREKNVFLPAHQTETRTECVFLTLKERQVGRKAESTRSYSKYL